MYKLSDNMEQNQSCYNCKFFSQYYFKFKTSFKPAPNGVCDKINLPNKKRCEFLQCNSCNFYCAANSKEELSSNRQTIEKALFKSLKDIKEILILLKSEKSD